MGTRMAYLHYPPWGISNNKITYIQALDQYNRNTGGYARVLGGGVGYSYVTLGFKSRYFRGMKFIVEIYGK